MNNDTEQAPEATSSEAEVQPSVAELTAKTEAKDVLNGLINDLHNLILITISAVYYFDCFSLLYLLRFSSQNQSRTVGVRIVIVANAVCILTHLLHTLPKPTLQDKWNHGGMLVDFVGEKPTSRFKLLLFDFLILGLQILHLALFYKKPTVGDANERTSSSVQDLDAEEAGISRANPPTTVETDEGIEMQSLLQPQNRDDEREGSSTQDLEDTIIVLRKPDFKEVFLNTTRNADSEESASRLAQVFQRLNAIRARRAALEAAAATTSANTS